MTTYRLPEALGGGEAELVQWKCDGYPSFASLQVDGVVVIVPHEHLVEVKPSPPPEPPVGTFVHLASYFGVYERLDRGWLMASDATGRAVDWDHLLRLNSGDAPVRLVPAAEPVKLPWSHTDPEGYEVGVHFSQRIWAAARVGQGDHCADLTADACRAMACALWTAAGGAA